MTENVISFRINEIELFERPMKLRLPFQFGDVVVRQTTEAYLSVKIELNGKFITGYSAQAMIPRWFDKRPELNSQQTVEELRDSLRKTSLIGQGMQGFIAEISAQVRAEVFNQMPKNTPRLAAGFGPAMLEMALIDAVCQAVDVNFFQAAQLDVFGMVKICPSDISTQALSGHLKSIKPKYSIGIRHTVGYDAPLTKSEISKDPDDGLPVALEDAISNTQITAFKIKLKGNAKNDIERLKKISIVLESVKNCKITLDANEQYEAEEFNIFIEDFQNNPALTKLQNATIFIEQPYAREIALTESGPKPPQNMPIIIDESDDQDDSFVQAYNLGWSGVSVKSCKGVLRALLNFARVREIQANNGFAILTGEDLTCQPGLCWQQDTLMSAAVGIGHVERNGHHFAGGMQGAPSAEIAAVMKLHSDIYKFNENAPSLNIIAGQVNFSSLNAPGFGHVIAPDLQQNNKILTK